MLGKQRADKFVLWNIYAFTSVSYSVISSVFVADAAKEETSGLWSAFHAVTTIQASDCKITPFTTLCFIKLLPLPFFDAQISAMLHLALLPSTKCSQTFNFCCVSSANLLCYAGEVLLSHVTHSRGGKGAAQ